MMQFKVLWDFVGLLIGMPAFRTLWTFGWGYCTYFECFSHMVVACNRLLIMTDRHNERRVFGIHKQLFLIRCQVWSGTPFKVIVALQFSVPFVLAFPRLMDYLDVVDRVDAVAVSGTVEWIRIVSARCNGRCTINTVQYNGAAGVSIALSTSLISFGLELRTLLVYRRLSNLVRVERRDDYLLLCKTRSIFW